MSTKLSSSRRRFLAGTSTLLALSATPVYLNAAQVERVSERFTQVSRHQGVVVYKPGIQYSEQFASIFSAAGLQVIALGDDPVRQWRDGMQQLVCSDSLPVIGLTNWADYFMIRGLGSEDRMYPLMENRHLLSDMKDSNWAMNYADELLQASSNLQNLREINKVAAADNAAGKGNSLFSWVIG